MEINESIHYSIKRFACISTSVYVLCGLVLMIVIVFESQIPRFVVGERKVGEANESLD